MTAKSVHIEDKANGIEVTYSFVQVDDRPPAKVMILMGDYDDAHLLAELMRRARSVGLINP